MNIQTHLSKIQLKKKRKLAVSKLSFKIGLKAKILF